MPSDEPTCGLPFDSGAAAFEERAGLPESVQLAVANALFRMAGLRAERRILDVGAGTGDIGLQLVQLGANYAGFDASVEMVNLFRARAAAAGLSPALTVADARGKWPADDSSVSVIFGSRSLHLIEASHVAREARRVARQDGARLVVGRVNRDADSPRAVIRREMHRLLRASGVLPRGSRENDGALRSALAGSGAAPFPEAVVAEWTVSRAPRASLDDWESKPGLAGTALDGALKREILAELRTFVERRFDDIDAPLPSVERYSLSGFAWTERTLDEK